MKRWIKSVSHIGNPFILLMLLGRFKRVTGEKLFCQPLAAKTNNGRRLDTWFGRLLSCFKKSGSEQDPHFSQQQWERDDNYGNGRPFSRVIEGSAATESVGYPRQCEHRGFIQRLHIPASRSNVGSTKC